VGPIFSGAWREEVSEEKRLGRGLDSLLSPLATEPVERRESGIAHLDPTKVKPNPFQPRESISEESVAELAGSIRTNGVLQPVVVRMGRDGYELISGERRLRATIKAGLPTVPAIVRHSPGTR
jgi:ParB family chromosome partitioning protein